MRDIIASMIVWLSGHSWLNLTFPCSIASSPSLLSPSRCLLFIPLSHSLVHTQAITFRFSLFVSPTLPFPIRLCPSPFPLEREAVKPIRLIPRGASLSIPYQYSMPLNCFLTLPGPLFYFITQFSDLAVLRTRCVTTQRGQENKNKMLFTYFHKLDK